MANEIILPRDLPPSDALVTSDVLVVDDGVNVTKATVGQLSGAINTSLQPLVVRAETAAVKAEGSAIRAETAAQNAATLAASEVREEVFEDANRAEAAAERAEDAAITASGFYSSRAGFQAANVEGNGPWTVQHDNLRLEYVADKDGTQYAPLTSLNGVKAVPAPGTASPAHWGAVRDGSTATPTDALLAFQSAVNWAFPRSEKIRVHGGGAGYAWNGTLYLRNATADFTQKLVEGDGAEATKLYMTGQWPAVRRFITSEWGDYAPQGSAMDNMQLRGFSVRPHPSREADPVHTVPVSLGVNGNTDITDVAIFNVRNTNFSADCSYNLRLKKTEFWQGGVSFEHRAIPDTMRFAVTAGSATVTASADLFVAGDVGKPFAVSNAVRGNIVSVTNARTVVLDTTSYYTEGSSYGTFGHPTLNITNGSTTATANASCFGPEHVGLWITVDDARTGPNKFLRARIESVTNSTTIVLNRAPTKSGAGRRFGVPVREIHVESTVRRAELGQSGPDLTNDVTIEDGWVELCGGILSLIHPATKVRITRDKLHGFFPMNDKRATLSCFWASNVEAVVLTQLIESFTTDSPIYVTSQHTETLRLGDMQAIVAKGKPLVEVGAYQGVIPGQRGGVVIGNVAVTNAYDHELFVDNNTPFTSLLRIKGDVSAPNRRYEGERLRVLHMGDSITEETTSWSRIVARRNGWDDTNIAKGGATMRGAVGTASDRATLAAQLAVAIADGTLQSANMVLISFGTNDTSQQVPFGTMGSTDITTFYGAMEVNYATILAANPTATVVFTTPIRRNDGLNGANELYRQAIRRFCKAKRIACVDTTNFGLNDQNITAYLRDAVHPTPAGHDAIARPMAKAILSVTTTGNANVAVYAPVFMATSGGSVTQAQNVPYSINGNQLTLDFDNTFNFNVAGLPAGAGDFLRIGLPNGVTAANLSGVGGIRLRGFTGSFGATPVSGANYFTLFSDALNRPLLVSDVAGATSPGWLYGKPIITIQE